MNIKFKVTSSFTMILFFSLIISQKTIRAEEQQWEPVPVEDYAEVLELIAYRAKANYDTISYWQGRMNILETSHFYGTNAAEKSYTVDATNSIARDSQHICKVSNTVADFAIDMRNDKIYSSVDPNVQYKAVDLEQVVPTRRNVRTPRTRTILTPERYIWYMPSGKFHSESQKGPPGKMVFIESSQNENVKGFVRDPRLFFELEGHRKIWETLLQLRSNINMRIKERIAGYPHIEISSLNTGNGIKYRILTTWKASESYYIRSLLEVDEGVGFNAIKTEKTNPDGVRIDLKEYTYEKIGEIYILKTIKKEQPNNKGEIKIASEITIETTGINKPLPEDTFTIKNLGLEEGMLVIDNIRKAEFRYIKGNLVPIAVPNR